MIINQKGKKHLQGQSSYVRKQNHIFSDFEDCLQMECAKAYGAEYIVTRNLNDYKVSEIKAILPRDYLELLKQNVFGLLFGVLIQKNEKSLLFWGKSAKYPRK